jgi:hypothetical protein
MIISGESCKKPMEVCNVINWGQVVWGDNNYFIISLFIKCLTINQLINRFWFGLLIIVTARLQF